MANNLSPQELSLALSLIDPCRWRLPSLIVNALRAVTVDDPSWDGEPAPVSYRQLAGWLAGEDVQGRYVWTVLRELEAARVLERDPGRGTRASGWRVTADVARWRVPWRVPHRVVVERFARLRSEHNGRLVPRSHVAAQEALVPRSHVAAQDQLAPRPRARHKARASAAIYVAAQGSNGDGGGYISRESETLSLSSERGSEELSPAVVKLLEVIREETRCGVWGRPFARLVGIAARADGNLPALVTAVRSSGVRTVAAALDVLEGALAGAELAPEAVSTAVDPERRRLESHLRALELADEDPEEIARVQQALGILVSDGSSADPQPPGPA